MKFVEKVIALEEEIKNYILSKVQDGEKLELVTQQQIAESDNDVLYELPQVDCENRHDEIIRYGIVAIERKGITINFYGNAIGEYLGESYIFSFYEINANELSFIADYLK